MNEHSFYAQIIEAETAAYSALRFLLHIIFTFLGILSTANTALGRVPSTGSMSLVASGVVGTASQPTSNASQLATVSISLVSGNYYYIEISPMYEISSTGNIQYYDLGATGYIYSQTSLRNVYGFAIVRNSLESYRIGEIQNNVLRIENRFSIGSEVTYFRRMYRIYRIT